MYIARQVPRAIKICYRSSYATSIALLPFRRTASSRTYRNDTSVWHLNEVPARMSVDLGRQTLYSKARRRFSTSPVAMHGHLTPPKPGEE